MHHNLARASLPLVGLILLLAASSCTMPAALSTATPGTGSQSQSTGEPLVLYSGRSESLVGPLIAQFEEASGIAVETRWGETPELAATLLEEGDRSPADVFFAQDPGGLGAVAGMLALLPDDVLDRVDTPYRDVQGHWVGVSGRARVVVYNTERVQPEELPQDLWGFTDSAWRGRLGWAPGNASFQTMVTAMRASWGEEETRRWLEEMLANGPVTYDENTAIVAAVGAGEIDAGFTNHYYLYRFLREEGEQFPARNYFLPGGGPGSLVMVAGAGVLGSSDNQEAAHELLRFLLSPAAQQYFAEETSEYPLAAGIEAPASLPPLDELDATQMDLSSLADLQGTARLLRETGVIP